jgi:hypothetical protein
MDDIYRSDEGEYLGYHTERHREHNKLLTQLKEGVDELEVLLAHKISQYLHTAEPLALLRRQRPDDSSLFTVIYVDSSITDESLFELGYKVHLDSIRGMNIVEYNKDMVSDRYISLHNKTKAGINDIALELEFLKKIDDAVRNYNSPNLTICLSDRRDESMSSINKIVRSLNLVPACPKRIRR